MTDIVNDMSIFNCGFECHTCGCCQVIQGMAGKSSSAVVMGWFCYRTSDDIKAKGNKIPSVVNRRKYTELIAKLKYKILQCHG